MILPLRRTIYWEELIRCCNEQDIGWYENYMQLNQIWIDCVEGEQK